MAEKKDFENERFSNFQGLVTLTLTLDRVIRHTVMHQSSNSIHTSKTTASTDRSAYDERQNYSDWLVHASHFFDGGGETVFRRRLRRGWFRKFPEGDTPGPKTL